MTQLLLPIIFVLGCRQVDVGPVANARPPLRPVDASDLAVHLAALQTIADANNGHRSTGAPGFDASVDYVATTLERWGYTTRRQPFSFFLFQQLLDERLSTSDGTAYEWGTNFLALGYSPPGDVTAPTFALPFTPSSEPPNSSTSGCEPAHWRDFPAGHIAVIQRGGCAFTDKVKRAQAAGAVAALIVNEGQPGRDGLALSTLRPDVETQIPSMITDYQTGIALARASGPVRLVTRTVLTRVDSQNLHATLPGKTDATIIVGAHLDRVPEGPGINDNGTGVALTLELARRLATRPETTAKRIQFSFWGAEESGLYGSYAFANDPAQLAPIDLYLNFDMVGSPNGFPFVLDTDADATALGVDPHPGSGPVNAAFAAWFEREGVAYATTSMLGKSDHAPFMLGHVPVSGLFTGANETVLTTEQAASTGGTPGLSHDDCYHYECDTLDNVNLALLATLTRAAEHVVGELARQPSPTNRPQRPVVPAKRTKYLTHAAPE